MQERDVKSLLIPQVQELYEAVVNHSKLSTVDCQVVLCSNVNHVQKWEVVFTGALTHCLEVAFEEATRCNQVEVWLPIGENTYTFVTLRQAGNDVEQETFLLKRVIEFALATTKELEDYEHAMLEAGTFDEIDIFNALDMLSPLTYSERIDRQRHYTPFEALSFDIQVEGDGSADATLHAMPLDSLLNPAEPLLLKGLLHLRDLELGVNEADNFLSKLR